jgi:hypothetical protein
MFGLEVEDTRAGLSWATKSSGPASLLGRLGGLGQVANGPKWEKMEIEFKIDF